QAASSVLTTSAILNGLVNPDGAATMAWFEYGLTTSYGAVSASVSVGSGNSAMAVSTTVSNLTVQTNYHFRVGASNSFGIVFGADQAFATASGVPFVTTLEPTDGGATTMRLNGSVIPNGASANAWFEWGATTNYGNTTTFQGIGNGITQTNYSQPLTGLSVGTSYHFRAAASSSFGTNLGADLLFTPLFTDIAATITPISSGSVAWGDYDSDGRLDVLLAGQTGIG